jgi:hypothetical protein
VGDAPWGTLTLAEIKPDRIAEARDALVAEPYTRARPHTDKNTGVVRPPKEERNSSAGRRSSTDIWRRCNYSSYITALNQYGYSRGGIEGAYENFDAHWYVALEALRSCGAG